MYWPARSSPQYDHGPWCEAERHEDFLREPANSLYVPKPRPYIFNLVGAPNTRTHTHTHTHRSDLTFLVFAIFAFIKGIKDLRTPEKYRKENLIRRRPVLTIAFAIANMYHFLGTFFNHACCTSIISNTHLQLLQSHTIQHRLPHRTRRGCWRNVLHTILYLGVQRRKNYSTTRVLSESGRGNESQRHVGGTHFRLVTARSVRGRVLRRALQVQGDCRCGMSDDIGRVDVRILFLSLGKVGSIATSISMGRQRVDVPCGWCDLSCRGRKSCVVLA